MYQQRQHRGAEALDVRYYIHSYIIYTPPVCEMTKLKRFFFTEIFLVKNISLRIHSRPLNNCLSKLSPLHFPFSFSLVK